MLKQLWLLLSLVWAAFFFFLTTRALAGESMSGFDTAVTWFIASLPFLFGLLVQAIVIWYRSRVRVQVISKATRYKTAGFYTARQKH